MATHNPSTSISGHVTVDLHPLAQVAVDGDGVDAAQGVSVHQVLGAVLRVSKDTTTCRRKFKPNPEQSDTLSACLGLHWV